MGLAQLHYTSAPPGPDGPGSGFVAVTPGIPRSLLDEVERLIGYEPPEGAPPHPTDAEPASLPQAFSHSVLSDGSRLLARTVGTMTATGTGTGTATGTGGSHTHAVLLPRDAGLPGGGLPISAWNSVRWATSAPESGTPAPLEELPPLGLLGRDVLVGFAAARAPWLARFFAGLREQTNTDTGIGTDTDSNTGTGTSARIVLVERSSADVAQWIALACAALPREHAEPLTFTTYTRRPREATQRIVGVLPDGVREWTEPDQRLRVLDCTGRAPAPTGPPPSASPRYAAYVWGEIAARVWLGRAPEVFTEAAALPGGALSHGALAFAALCADITLGPEGRTEAATWAGRHARELSPGRLHRLVEALAAPAEDHRTEAECAALARLFTALDTLARPTGRDGGRTAATLGVLGALVLTTAVRMDRVPQEPLPEAELSALPEELKRRLADELAPGLLAGIADDTGPDIARPVELLRVAAILGVDCTELLPGLAAHLVRALSTDPETARVPAVRTVLEDHFELRTALLGALDAHAADDPAAATRLLGAVDLPLGGVQTLPHLRMCAGAPWTREADGDGLSALHAALRACGVSAFTDPLVLRTAVRLVWGGGAPTAGEAGRLLGETGSDAHRAAGTWTTLVRAALDSPADDPDAPDLAHDLLRCFPDRLEPRVRGALLLLDFLRELGSGRAEPPWTERALSLRADTEPVEPTLLDRLFTTLGRQLLSEERPEGELYTLIHCGEPALLTAYAAAAQEPRVADRLRTSPAYAAHCFVAWSSLPGASAAWDTTRTALRDKVLRPAVRALPDADVAAVEHHLEQEGAHRAEEFRAWNRPGTLSRLGRRFGSLGRQR
ncbi:GTPase-associated protein 1-related protein [Streptomyces sp. JV176]|uniref:GTPase-associated protein 1-related protein n=1 Tax=Streptomyces sp. JV176 TaxID=858630 RepID=UPI002E7A7C5F|nr:GTPase-associated protein 1-related protein [Streptomyces sp. JV176]MEE1797754.1 GTPase-associated protein 1-related protein [Streptomyces sp. JV176]